MANKSTTRAEGATIVANEDGSPIPLVITPAGMPVIRNGSTGTLNVALGVKPSANVTVTASIVDGSGKLSISSGATLTFTPANYSTPQTVTFQSVAAQAGWQRVLFAPSGADYPGVGAVTVHILVS